MAVYYTVDAANTVVIKKPPEVTSFCELRIGTLDHVECAVCL